MSEHANVAEIIILFVFFPTITSKYVYQLSEKTFLLSVFDFSGLRDPHFQEIRYFVFVGTLGVFSLSNSENLLTTAQINR